MNKNSKSKYIKKISFIILTSLLALIGFKNIQIKKVFSNTEFENHLLNETSFDLDITDNDYPTSLKKTDQSEDLILKEPNKFDYTNNSNELIVYSGRHYYTDRLVFKNFSREFGIKILLKESTGISLIEKLRRDGPESKADVILLVDVARASMATKLGLFQPISSTKINKLVPRKYRESNGHWFGITKRTRVIVVNPKLVNINSIKNYKDLSNPTLKGKLCLRNRKSPYNQSLVSDYLISNGDTPTRNWLNGMISNVSQPFFSGDTAIIRAIAMGKCGVGIVNHYYVERMVAGINGRRDALYSKRVKVIIPNPTHMNISVAGIGTHSENKLQAINFLEYLVSNRGSKALSSPTFEHPINGLNTNLNVDYLGVINANEITMEDIGNGNTKALRLMIEYGWK